MARVGERVMAVITSHSVQGLEIMNTRTRRAAEMRGGDASMLDDARFIAQVLLSEGFEILNFHALAISFAGTPEAFERVFGIRVFRRKFPGGRGRQVDGFDVDPDDADRLSALPPIFDGRAGLMAIARPPRLIDETVAPLRDVTASDLQIWSLPDEFAISIWADGTSPSVTTGHGIVAAQIGTGHYRHRFFSDRGYRTLPTLLGPGQTQPQRDDHGHSTGEAACLFSAAPDLRLRPIKGLLDPVGDLLVAIDSAPIPDLVINSWGYDADHRSWDELARTDRNLHHYLRILEAVIVFAQSQGVDICATAPRTWKSFPACHPDVIAIGAVSESRAAQQACRDVSVSGLYPGRTVPDLWSDAAKSVRAGMDLISCTHPVQPGSALARPELQDIGADEGFAWCDIEQAAAPLAASRLALLLEQQRGRSPGACRAMIAEIARDASVQGLEPAGEPGPRVEPLAGRSDFSPGQLVEQPGHVMPSEHPGMGSIAG